MQIIVINLPGDATRRRLVAEQFDQVGLRFSWHEAVPGSELAPDEPGVAYCAQLNRRQYHQALRPGEIGCYESHRAVWQRFVDSGQPRVAVFEDDIEIDGDLGRVLDTLARSPARWDLVKLIGRARERVQARFPLGRGRDLVSYRRLPSLTGGYVLTRTGAQKLLARRQRFGRPVDVDIRHWWECDLDVLGVQPYPVREAVTSRRSTIDGRRRSPGLAGRLRRLWLQLRYTVLNALANQARLDDGLPRGARRAVNDWPEARDVR